MARPTDLETLALAAEHVNHPWVISLAFDDATSLAPLRLVGGIEVGEDGGMIWVRGQGTDEKTAARLSSLPARSRYEWIAPNQLRLLGERIPSGRLPVLHWVPLSSWLQAELPVAALPAEPPSPVQLRLVRSTDERGPDVLMTNLEELLAYAATTARVRLDPLQFAADGKGNVIVRGRPLPALPGRRFVLHGSIAIPAGFSWEPAVSKDTLARHFAVSPEAMVLWDQDNTVIRLHSEQLVPLTRSALRATLQALAMT